MLAKIKIRQSNIDKLVRRMVVLIDSREQENKHITEYLDNRKIPYEVRGLESGDYSVMLKADAELELPFDLSLENLVAVERKGSGGGLSEIAGNFTNGRTAFENEFIRAKEKGTMMFLVIEDGSWEDIEKGNYRSEMHPNSLYASLLSWERKYDIHIHFVTKAWTAVHIVKILASALKKILEE